MKFSDLTEQQVQEICEAFAKREGIWRDDIPVMRINFGGPPMQVGVRCTKQEECSDYLNDLNAMHRIIIGMDDMELMRYVDYLSSVVNRGWGSHVLASCKEQFVAAALALGLIKESK